MAQWMNLEGIKRFINPCITCQKCGGLHLVEPDLMAGWLADKIWARLEVLKVCCCCNFSICLAKVLHYFSISNAFSGKHYYKVVL